jgi:uncharacterized protein (DUF433 family)
MIIRGAIVFQRIVSDPSVLGGKPCIRGTRISIEFILELIASGASRDDIIRGWPNLAAEDIEEAVLYAARFLKNEIFVNVELPH